MTRQQAPERAAGGPTPAELGELLRAEPPPFLDALVKERVGCVLARQRAALGEQPAETRHSPSGNITSAEACTYALGFVAYGAQLADGVARMLWRALIG